MEHRWLRAAEFSRFYPDKTQIALMERFHDWLSSEGVRAGGIGSSEIDRIDRRHLADSVLFASQLPADIDTVWDLGSGVGLPGVPLAICMPETEFVLIDRSGRRVDLLRRVVRILDLPNCHIRHSDFVDLSGKTEAMVSRASLPPEKLMRVVGRHLAPDGVAVVAGSWQSRPEHQGWHSVEIPSYVLDQTVWLLIMRGQ